MIGQGRPIVWKLYDRARLTLRALGLPLRILLLIVSLGSMLTTVAWTEEVNVRLRLAWGSGDSAKHRWVGRIVCADGKLSDVQPLGIEADAPVAVRLVDNELVVDPREPRGFDGCDVTIAGERNSLVRFELRSEQSSAPTVVEVPLSKLVKEQVRESIDSLGSVLLAYRSPGDRFRLTSKRDNLIFNPGEVWQARFQTDFAAELAAGPVTVEIVLRALGSDAVLWQANQVVTANSPAPDQLVLDLAMPVQEGGYRLSLNASAEQSFATRFVPGQGSKPFATREIDLVVIDPTAKLPTLVDQWVPLLSIDPANPGWWQRLPTWAQVSRLTGKPPGTLGNVRLLVRPGDAHGLVELAPSANAHDPSWQSFALPIQEAGLPHLVEITYPLAEKQHLGISVIEPDAAGRVTSAAIESGLRVDEIIEDTADQVGVYRLLFWPRTQSPQLLIVNRHATQPGVFGRIALLKQDPAAVQVANAVHVPATGRLIAGYIAKPVFAQNFGAAEVLDPVSGTSVQSWSTFLEGAQRFTQQLKLAGYNGALVSVAADGSTLYPSEHLAPSPRYDTGMLAASGQDPIRKDVLEMLLRVCDREGVRVIPTLQLASPLPRLEVRPRDARDTHSANVWLDAQGRELARVRRVSLAANYNILTPHVQEEVIAIVKELADRGGQHPSFSGIALQLNSNGFGVLPGLEWGFDDETVAAFTADTHTEIAATGERRFAERAAQLLDEHRIAWQTWRIKQLTDFYRKLAEVVRLQRQDLRLILTTEELFAEPTLEQAVRRCISQPARLRELLAERGIDLEQLAAIPGVEITNTRRLGSSKFLQERVTDLVINEASELGSFLPTGIDLNFRSAMLSRLASFDQQSPFGQQTHLVLAHLPTSSISFGTSVTTTGSYIDGGDYLPLVVNTDHARQLRALAELPKDCSEARTVCSQPLDIRVVRTADASFLICVNESPWPVSAKLDMESSSDVAWQLLGDSGQAGRLDSGKSAWPVQVPANGSHVWKFSSPQIRPGELHVVPNSKVREYLANRIQEIEARTGNLNIERDYAQLQNPGFELEGGEARIFGWQPHKGVGGSIEIDTSLVHGGLRSLRLKSVDQIGVAAQSHLFPLPETGMIVFTAQVRTSEANEGASLTLAIETDEQGQTYRRTRTISLGEEFSTQWKKCEMIVSDLPVGDAEQLRVQFHVTGKADVIIDDVALCDLHFDDQRRSELVKRVFAAKTALDEGQYTDCLRLLNEYWPQYLVAYVPPVVGHPAALAKQPENSTTKAPDDSTKSGGRFRNMLPRIWR
jgi:hypothetical protein